MMFSVLSCHFQELSSVLILIIQIKTILKYKEKLS